MPTRILREGIITSEPVNRLTPQAEIFYRRLMSVADDYGRFHAHPTLIRAACYPLQLERVTEENVKTFISECIQEELLSIYHGGKYLQIWRFKQQRRRQSKFPQPSEPELLIKIKSDTVQLESHLGAAPTPTSPSTPHPTPTHNGHSVERKRWHVKTEREAVQDRIKELRREAGQEYDGGAWRGKLDEPYKSKILKLKASETVLKEEFDNWPI